MKLKSESISLLETYMPSSHADSEHSVASAHQDLDKIKNDIEDIFHRLGNATDDQVEELREKARSALSSLRDIEQQAQARFHVTARETQKFVHEKPWTVVGTAALAAYALGLLTRLRR